MKIVGMAASLRSRISEKHIAALKKLKDAQYTVVYEALDRECRKGKLSNSDALLAFALWGAAKAGAEIDILFLNNEDENWEVTEDANGFILSTPVYFGNYSSLAYKMFEAAEYCHFLRGHVFGVCSVGAKRNGGQETTNVLAMRSALNCGAMVVGNGPKTSQYGGTAVAGDFGAVRSDDLGLDTAVGLGANIVRAAELIQKPAMELDIVTVRDLVVLKLGTCAGAFHVEYSVDQLRIKPCMACSWCPGDFDTEYKCRIRDDDFELLYNAMMIADLIYVDHKDSLAWRQFLERLRCIRRDNLKLGYKPVYDTDPYGFIKWLRQDMIILPELNFTAAYSIAQNKRGLSDYKLTYVPMGYGEAGVLPRTDLREEQ